MSNEYTFKEHPKFFTEEEGKDLVKYARQLEEARENIIKIYDNAKTRMGWASTVTDFELKDLIREMDSNFERLRKPIVVLFEQNVDRLKEKCLELSSKSIN